MVNRRVIEALIRAGAMDTSPATGPGPRAQLMATVALAMEAPSRRRPTRCRVGCST